MNPSHLRHRRPAKIFLAGRCHIWRCVCLKR
ncbi:hypothetical protein X963_5728 [Burkholderia pseudomallei MSHR7498]|nr:hypothetical protein X963_5728 [Burkholderia pseudomallei MSHR7498]